MSNSKMSNSKARLLPATIHSELKAIVDRFKQPDGNTQIVMYKDDIIEVCHRHKYGYYQKISVEQVGCHPSNRGGARVMIIHKG